MTSKPLVRRTFATLRSAEFGFFGVVVYTRVQTPRRCGLSCRAGLLLLIRADSRPLRTSWLTVGILGFLKPDEVLMDDPSARITHTRRGSSKFKRLPQETSPPRKSQLV